MFLFTLLHLLVFLAGVAAMEAMTWAMHRWVMHGPLWWWHRSHHDPGRGASFEPNDLFALVYVALAMALFWIGLDVLWWMALGVTAYGLLYVLVHEGLLHRRIPLPLEGPPRLPAAPRAGPPAAPPHPRARWRGGLRLPVGPA